MAIFKLTANDGSAAMVVRARCITCARSVAAENAGDEGTAVWRDFDRSKIELVRETDRQGLIMRAKNVN